MKVKICGITNLKHALQAIDAGADALGFVFFPESPRYVSPEKAKEIISQLPPFVEKVALFVNNPPEEINQICHYIGATLAQIHFEMDETLFSKLDIPYLKVVRAQSSEDIFRYQNEYRLIDAYCESYGGSGKRLNLEWFSEIDCSKIILAGGLEASNIASIMDYGFYGVDVSSGVEASKGIKDPDKVTEFIFQAKNCD